MADIVTLGGGPTIVHLTYRNNESDEQWHIACMPNVTNFKMSAHQPNYLRSNDTRAVTCNRCKETPIFAQVRSKER